MIAKPSRLDCIYVAAAAHDARYTRSCIASIRHFYPLAAVKLLPGGRLEAGLRAELARHWDVGIADIAPGEYGWGFVKLEPLFGPPGQRFLVVDSDTVFAGPVLEAFAASSADFLVDDERQSEPDTHRLYYNWRKVAAVDPAARTPEFVFNSGQWFGTAGVLARGDFTPWIEWTMPRRLRHQHCFHPSDQGVLNYVLNQKAALAGLRVERRRIMRWPGHGMDGITVASIINRTAPALVVHWAGFKTARLRALPGAEVLEVFERGYYGRLRCGSFLRHARACRYAMAHVWRSLAVRMRLLMRRLHRSPQRSSLPGSHLPGDAEPSSQV